MAPGSSQAQPPDDRTARALALLGLVVAVGAGVWAVAKFFGYPFLQWSHRVIHESAYEREHREEIERAQRVDLLLDRGFPDLFKEVLDMRADVEEHRKALEAFGETRENTRAVAATAQRLEQSLMTLGDNMIRVMREISEIRGAQRIHGEYRP